MLGIIPDLWFAVADWRRASLPKGDHQGGLSVRDSVVAAHRTLDELLGHLRVALEEGLAAPAAEACARLCEALETHFQQEDSLYYPSIAALRPQVREAVAQFAEAHDRFRRQFHEIDRLLQEDDLEQAGQTFDAFAEGFARHEAAEEALLTELDHEVAASR